MKILKFATEAELDRAAAEFVAAQLNDAPDSVLGLPTGGTPVGLYANLSAMVAQGKVSLKNATTFNLDEYIGLAQDHPCSYYRFMHENLFDHVDCPESHVHIPEGNAADPTEACARYERDIAAAGGIDLQVLGIGSNGHIGFNEPGTPPELFTHVTDLTETTIRDNARFFESIDEVPRHAMTMGLASILQAKKVLLIAKGAGKADVLEKMVNGPVTPAVPASYLQQHADVTVMVDEQAGAKL